MIHNNFFLKPCGFRCYYNNLIANSGTCAQFSRFRNRMFKNQ